MQINDAVAKIFKEDQVYRIDHYLGKETVQNLLALRFANILFEPIWNSAHIDHVQITVAESVGAGTRGYYDESGALRDMIQNHMHAAALPRRHGAAGLRRCQCAARRKAQGAALAEADRRRRRRQAAPCAASIAASAPMTTSVASYQDELPEDKKGSRTETFVALKAEIENWRWSGVPFYLRTGKRMADPRLRDRHPVPHHPALDLRSRRGRAASPTGSIIRLQPDEGVKLIMMIKDPGPGGMRLREVPLNLSFAADLHRAHARGL